jgi:hypothetical protein
VIGKKICFLSQGFWTQKSKTGWGIDIYEEVQWKEIERSETQERSAIPRRQQEIKRLLTWNPRGRPDDSVVKGLVKGLGRPESSQ